MISWKNLVMEKEEDIKEMIIEAFSEMEGKETSCHMDIFINANGIVSRSDELSRTWEQILEDDEIAIATVPGWCIENLTGYDFVEDILHCDYDYKDVQSEFNSLNEPESSFVDWLTENHPETISEYKEDVRNWFYDEGINYEIDTRYEDALNIAEYKDDENISKEVFEVK